MKPIVIPDDAELEVDKGLNAAELAAIGRVAVASAKLEGTVSSLLITLTKLQPEMVEVLLERAMLDARLTIFLSVAEIRLHRRKKRLDELKAMVSCVRGLNEQRTVVIHGSWMTHSFSDHKQGIGRNPKATKWKRGRPTRHMNIKDVLELAKRLEDCRWTLWEFCRKTWPRSF